MSIDNLHKHQENNSNNSSRSNSYVDDTGRVIDRKWEARKIMASTAKQVPQNDQFIIVNGRRVYHTAEGERRANYRVASAQPMRSEGELLSEAQRIAAEQTKRLAALTAASRNNNTYNPRVKDYDMPLAVKIAMRSLD